MIETDKLIEASRINAASLVLNGMAPDATVKQLREVADRSFKAGAKWQLEQMLKGVVDASVTFDYYDASNRLNVVILATDVLADEHGIKDKDMVKLIIVKEGHI